MKVWCGGNWNGAAFGSAAMAILRDAVPGLIETETPEGEILFGQPDPDAALALSDLRWIQITSAGYTRYDTDAFRRGLAEKGAAFTNSSSVFDEPCAQHLLAFLLAHARQLPESIGDREWRVEEHRRRSRLLQSGRLLIVGHGAIGRRLVELLAPFGMDITAVRRTVRGDEGIPTFPIEELDRLLPGADYVANILPASDSTVRLFDADRFARMKAGAIFLNIGRGMTVDQDALLEALPRLAAVYLDVTDPEPLPADHPLWNAPNVYITPHTAGGHEDEEIRLVRHFVANLVHFRANEPLRDRVI